MTKLDRIKKRIYEIVEASHKGDFASKAYDIMIFVAVVVGLIPLMLKPSVQSANIYVKLIDIFTVVLFLLDYVLRVFTADYKMGVKIYKAYIAYAFSPMAIVDLLSIIPILSILPGPAGKIFSMFRIFRVFRLLKLARYSKTMRIIENVIRRVKSQLFAVLLLTVIYIIATAMIIYQVEPEAPVATFNSFFEAVYWSAISITTIGYGDISPQTDIGRFITVLSSLVGVAVIALPSGIITAAYMKEITKKKGEHEL